MGISIENKLNEIAESLEMSVTIKSNSVTFYSSWELTSDDFDEYSDEADELHKRVSKVIDFKEHTFTNSFGNMSKNHLTFRI